MEAHSAVLSVTLTGDNDLVRQLRPTVSHRLDHGTRPGSIPFVVTVHSQPASDCFRQTSVFGKHLVMNAKSWLFSCSVHLSLDFPYGRPSGSHE